MLSGFNKQTQNVKILTDIELQYPSIICPVVAVIQPPMAFIAISSDYRSLVVDEAVLTSMIPESVRNYPFSLQVSSPTFPLLVQQATY